MISPVSDDLPSVLLCEGDGDLRRVLAALLERAGHAVCQTADARDAMSAAIGASADCIVLSLPIPGGDTPELIRSVRGLAPSARLVAISPDDPALDDGEGPAGVDEWLPPTFAPRDLIAAVQRAGSRRRSAAASD